MAKQEGRRRRQFRESKQEVPEYNEKKGMTGIDEMLVLLRDEEKRYSTAFGKLIAERQNAHSVLKCYLGRQPDCLSPAGVFLVTVSLCFGAVLEQAPVGQALVTFIRLVLSPNLESTTHPMLNTSKKQGMCSEFNWVGIAVECVDESISCFFSSHIHVPSQPRVFELVADSLAFLANQLAATHIHNVPFSTTSKAGHISMAAWGVSALLWCGLCSCELHNLRDDLMRGSRALFHAFRHPLASFLHPLLSLCHIPTPVTLHNSRLLVTDIKSSMKKSIPVLRARGALQEPKQFRPVSLTQLQGVTPLWSLLRLQMLGGLYRAPHVCRVPPGYGVEEVERDPTVPLGT